MSARRDRLVDRLRSLVAIPGVSGYEDRVAAWIAGQLRDLGHAPQRDVLGNLWVTVPGGDAPSVMVIAHMDQIGFVVRKLRRDGLMHVDRVGGVPERALAAQEVLICLGEGRDLPALIGNRSYHATPVEDRRRVLGFDELAVDAGFDTDGAARAAGIRVGTPIACAPRVVQLGGGRIAATSLDDRAACAVVLEIAAGLAEAPPPGPVHLVFSVQEEFNIRGVLPLARTLAPKAAIQLDLSLAADTPEMEAYGEVRLGGGPVMGLYAFHGRGSLNGLIPHPGMVALVEAAADATGLGLQRGVQLGALTETSYVQHVGAGVACVDLGFPARYAHSAREVCDPRDIEGLAELVLATLARMEPGVLDRAPT